MNKVLLTTLLIIGIQGYFTISEILLKLNLSLLSILQCGTSKVESDREKAEMFSNYFYSVFISSDFVLPNYNLEELDKHLISDISHSGLKKFIKYLVPCRLKGLVVPMLQFFKLVPPH